MSYSLGQWAVIDIETTGINPSDDEIIDIGFMQFDEDKLVREYESLVQYRGELSFFIQKLTGITSAQVKRAPSWSVVEPELLDLYGHSLVAHNADFEQNFLEKYFDDIEDETPRETYEDSLNILGMIFPYKSSLKLESFIVDWKIAEEELHRGLSDSKDLLKVLLVAAAYLTQEKEIKEHLRFLVMQNGLEDDWCFRFIFQEENVHENIARTLEFDPSIYVVNVYEQKKVENKESVSRDNLGFSGETIKSIFQNTDSLKKVFPGYSYRHSQESMALKVGQSFKNNIHSLVQAPTGTGKTFAYMIPAALYALEEDNQVLIATGTKTLQDQAMNKDFPFVRKFLGLDEGDVRVVKLIGSSNHFCELAFGQMEDDLLLSSNELYKWAKVFYEMIFFYNGEFSQNSRIVRGTTPYVLKMKNSFIQEIDDQIKVDFRACVGKRCEVKERCSYYQGIQEAQNAHIIIGNHSLMYSWPSSFPRPSHVIVDEAHRLEHETTSAFRVEVSEQILKQVYRLMKQSQGVGALYYLLSNTGDEDPQDETINSIREETNLTAEKMHDHLLSLESLVELFFKQTPRYTDLYWNEVPMLEKKGQYNSEGKAIFNHFDSLSFILQEYQKFILPYWSRFSPEGLKDENQISAYNRFETFWGQVEDLIVGFDYLLEKREDYANSFCFKESDGFVLKAAPINVGKIVHERLLECSSSVVMTSATLGNAEGSSGTKGVEWSSGYVYLPPEKRFKSGLFLPSVYDYKEKARVFVCDDVLPMYNSSFVPEVLTPFIELIKKLDGRALLLFSARARFDIAREILLKEFEGKIPLFIQGMGTTVIEDFKKEGHGILLGMESFAEGVDIPGDLVQVILIDKIPDIRMEHVTEKRRDFYEREIGNEFVDYYLASRTRSLHQKLGRLLRTESDFGGVIIVDSRMKKWKGRTLDTFFRQMEPYNIKRKPLKDACDEVYSFISKT